MAARLNIRRMFQHALRNESAAAIRWLLDVRPMEGLGAFNTGFITEVIDVVIEVDCLDAVRQQAEAFGEDVCAGGTPENTTILRDA